MEMVARLIGTKSESPAGIEQHAIISQSAPDAGSKNGLRILLAEDNPANVKLTTLVLTKAGFRVDVARNGHEAVAKYTSFPGTFRFDSYGRPDAGNGWFEGDKSH